MYSRKVVERNLKRASEILVRTQGYWKEHLLDAGGLCYALLSKRSRRQVAFNLESV